MRGAGKRQGGGESSGAVHMQSEILTCPDPGGGGGGERGGGGSILPLQHELPPIPFSKTDNKTEIEMTERKEEEDG